MNEIKKEEISEEKKDEKVKEYLRNLCREIIRKNIEVLELKYSTRPQK